MFRFLLQNSLYASRYVFTITWRRWHMNFFFPILFVTFDRLVSVVGWLASFSQKSLIACFQLSGILQPRVFLMTSSNADSFPDIISALRFFWLILFTVLESHLRSFATLDFFLQVLTAGPTDVAATCWRYLVTPFLRRCLIADACSVWSFITASRHSNFSWFFFVWITAESSSSLRVLGELISDFTNAAFVFGLPLTLSFNFFLMRHRWVRCFELRGVTWNELVCSFDGWFVQVSLCLLSFAFRV